VTAAARFCGVSRQGRAFCERASLARCMVGCKRGGDMRAHAFSPPDSCSMSRKRFVGGMAVNLTPARYGSSSLSRLRYAVPPVGCVALRRPAHVSAGWRADAM
jgi:hypothetical protein